MSTPSLATPISAGQPGEGLKSILQLLKGAAPTSDRSPAVQPGQIAAELAYKLAQASSIAKDRKMLIEGIIGLWDAMEHISVGLSGGE